MKVELSALVDSLSQSSGGITIQESYGGTQLHLKAYQKKKRTPKQQRTRMNFTAAQSGWRSLSPEEINSWNSAAGPGQSGFELYSSINNRLAAADLPIIPEYQSPVSPPTNDLVIESTQSNTTPGEKEYTVNLESPGSNFPVSGWTIYILWTGWITASQTRFPEMKLRVPQGNIGTPTDEGFAFSLAETTGTNMANFSTGSKANFDIGLINNTTGQVFSYMIFNAVAE